MATALSSSMLALFPRCQYPPLQSTQFRPTHKRFFRIPTSLSITSPACSCIGTMVEDGSQSDEAMSIDNLKRFIDLNLGHWTGSFHQFDCTGNLLHKISTKLASSSYGEDELISLIQSLYIKQPLLSSLDSNSEPEWFEYKIKESNMFTVDKYQQIGFFPKEKAFSLRYQTAGMLETVIRQGVLGEDDTGEVSPRNLKLPSRRPAVVCETCLYSLEQDSRLRAFHILDPQGILEMLLVFLEERGSRVAEHPAFGTSKDSCRLAPHLGTWVGHSLTKRSGVYGATIVEADTVTTLEINEDGQLVQDMKSSTSGDKDVTTSVQWTGSTSGNLATFDGGFRLTLLPGGVYMGCPTDVAKSVQEFKSFHLELCWAESSNRRQRLLRTYDVEGLHVSSTYFLENRPQVPTRPVTWPKAQRPKRFCLVLPTTAAASGKPSSFMILRRRQTASLFADNCIRRRLKHDFVTLLLPPDQFMVSHTQALSSQPLPDNGDDDSLCGAEITTYSVDREAVVLSRPCGYLAGEARIEKAWSHWNQLGSPKFIVAPMVDNSELPFRLLCRKYGAQAAYTPMLHSRIFSENEKYRSLEFTTCQEDKPLFVQFCANDPDVLLQAARRVEPFCDYVDINLGCPQRIARRGNYGAFLMDNLPLVKSLVEKLAVNLSVPVSCKIRVFPDLNDTIKYAKMLEEAGCSLLAVHGRTRDEKDGKKFRANWKAIKAVREAVRIPVLSNGNIRHLEDAQQCLEETGVEGILSAESLLENPALFAGYRTSEWVDLAQGNSFQDAKLDQADLLVEYLKLCEKHPVPWRMIRSHVHKIIGEMFRIRPDVREDLNAQSKLTFEFLYGIIDKLREAGVRIPLYAKSEAAAAVA